MIRVDAIQPPPAFVAHDFVVVELRIGSEQRQAKTVLPLHRPVARAAVATQPAENRLHMAAEVRWRGVVAQHEARTEGEKQHASTDDYRTTDAHNGPGKLHAPNLSDRHGVSKFSRLKSSLRRTYMHATCTRRIAFAILAVFAISVIARADDGDPELAPEVVLSGLRDFYAKTARDDGSFRPGIDPDYLGMSDSAYSDLAAVTYACTIHTTFGWKLPHEAKTITWLHSRQCADGSFFNVAGTVDPNSAQGKTYNTTQGLVALHALGQKPKHNPLPVFEEILQGDYKQLPAYSTSFFPLAYLCYGQPIPEKADRGIRALMIQDETGYTSDHIAATFHASHYYRLVGEETPKSQEMIERILRDQQPDGSWLLNKPSRDRHATFDAVFTLLHEGSDRGDVKAAIDRAAQWALKCRNDDGGFGHYPGSTSDADAIYFNVGTLVMAGYLQPVDPLPKDPHLLSWGHLMPRSMRSRAG